MGSSKVSNSYYNAHEVVDKGDPKVNGPYLDDIRAAQEAEYRRKRMKNAAAKSNEDSNDEEEEVVEEEASSSEENNVVSLFNLPFNDEQMGQNSD